MEKAAPTLVKSPPNWPIFLLLAAAVIVPALFWQRVWLGASLSDEEIRRRLSQPVKPRQLQHACEQISKRMQRDPQGARQFYGLLVSLADHRDEQVRYVVAWCIGEDSSQNPPFHHALLRLAEDSAPRVRYNAALALARFGDPAARSVLCEMLMPYVVSAQWEGQSEEGTVVDILNGQDSVRPLMQLALLDTGEGELTPVLAPLGGQVGDVTAGLGDCITKGKPLCSIHPSSQQIYEALRALALVGQPQDLEYARRYFDPLDRASHGASHGQPTRIQTQARLAAEAIRKRQEQQGPDHS